jgi:hypothetical protein
LPKDDDDFAQIINSILELDEGVLKRLQERETFHSGATKQILNVAIASAEAKRRAAHLTRTLAQCFTFLLMFLGLTFGFILLLNGKHTEDLTSIAASLGGGGVLTIGRPLLKAVGSYELKKKAK